MTEVMGANDESIVFDGTTVTKLRHLGKDEAARNPVSTFRDVSITEKTSLLGKPKTPPQFDVLLVMSSIMSLTVDVAGTTAMAGLAEQIRQAASG